MIVSFAIASALIVSCVVIHFTALTFISDRLMPYLDHWGRKRLVAMFCVLIAAHILEIAVFAAAFWTIDGQTDLGALSGAVSAGMETGFRTYLYFSASAYTSLGFGDIVPTGELRLIASLETLCGLILIGWSASFTYLEMVRYWTGGR